MTIELNYSTNPFQNKQNPGEEKIAQMKKEQEAKRAEYASIVDEYRQMYKASNKKCIEAQSIFLQKQRELSYHDESEKNYNDLKKDFLSSKKIYQHNRSDKELRLQLLQFRADDYIKACKINLLDLA